MGKSHYKVIGRKVLLKSCASAGLRPYPRHNGEEDARVRVSVLHCFAWWGMMEETLLNVYIYYHHRQRQI